MCWGGGGDGVGGASCYTGTMINEIICVLRLNKGLNLFAIFIYV